ncbi:lysozyme [Novosphingobium kunmingense]|uniref:Lysozyme n=1 Tax=Novosphingobium kunmingense TaxID=1211806 RepID=A0A2N0H6T4_9SPHN|nr:glycoside hydrolase family 25 protein [Novosphingobium kunmingense]PKB14661.1 lysozyme [Novosphingobium kunmingense]
MARKSSSSRLRLRLFGAVWLLAMVAGAYSWWQVRHWRPDRADFPVQGVEIGTHDGTVDWVALKAIGANFAYIDASASAFARDDSFTRNLEDAKAAKVQIGALHRYDPCQPAERQAANFVTVVPRDARMLPPAVELDMLGDECPNPVSDQGIESELTTFLNQIEMHTGKAAILKITSRFQSRYRIAARIDRNLWLVRTRFVPDYAGRPWMLWTANGDLSNEATRDGLRWVVVQP